MKKILIILLLFYGQFAFAQEEFLNPYFEFSEGEELQLLNASALYKGPDFESEIIEKLPIGASVKIISKTEHLAVVKGNKTPFYKISYQNKKSVQKGYVWGGDISLKVENQSKNKKLIFLYGVSREIPFNKKENKKGEQYFVCKVLSSKKLIGQIEFKAIGLFDNYRNFNVFDNKGIEGIKNILSISFSNIYYPGERGEQLFFWNGKKILPLRDITNLSDPPCYYTEELIFPKDANGKKGFILMRSENGCNEGGQKIETKMSNFVWRKNRLVLIKESKID